MLEDLEDASAVARASRGAWSYSTVGHARSDRAVLVAARWSRRREALHDERKARFIAASLSGDRSDRRQTR